MKISAVLVLFILSVGLLGCPPPNMELNPEGFKVPLITSDLAQALPGRPLDKCAIKAHIETEYSYPCIPLDKINNMLRNKAASSGGNCVILTTYIDQAPCTFGGAHAVRGIVLSCSEEALKAAALK